MPSRNRLHISFNDEHADLLRNIEKNYHLKPSEFIRQAIEHIVESNIDLELWASRERLKRIEKDQAQVQVRIKELEAARPISANPGGEFQLPTPSHTPLSNSDGRTDPKPSYVDKRSSQTSEERWRLKLKYLLDPPKHLLKEDLEKIAASVGEMAQTHPEWIDRLSVAEQTAFRNKTGGIMQKLKNEEDPEVTNG